MWLAPVLLACSVAAVVVNADAPVENPVIESANGRFCAVVRYDPVLVTAALYETNPRRLVAEVPLEIARLGQLLVSDSGKYLVTWGGGGGGCTARATGSDPLITVYRTDGSRAGALNLDDVFNPYDIMQFWTFPRIELQAIDGREVAVVTIDSARRRVDLATVKLLDEKTDIYPRPRVYATPSTAARQRPYAPVDCAAMFDDPRLAHVEPAELFRRAAFGPLPVFPDIAIKARVRGTVNVEVVVAERGDVLCARSSYFLFGIDTAARAAARGWWFRPLRVNGRAVPFTGELLFHFEDLDEQTWLAAMRDAPPAR